MLYPDLNELLKLETKISHLKFVSNTLIKSVIRGDYFSPFRGHGLEFAEVRQYAYGDDIRKIDWRVTARTNTPHIKLFTEERERTVLIIVDLNASMRFGTRATFKSVQAANCAALIGWCANKNNNIIGSCLFGDVTPKIKFFRPKRSRKALFKMFQVLCDEPTLHPHVALEEVISNVNNLIPPTSLVFIISDFMDINNELHQQLKYLRSRRQVTLVSINDPADADITASGNIIFSDNNHQSLCIDTTNTNGRKAYNEQWQDRTSKLKNMSTSLCLNLIELQTNHDIYLKLFYGLKNTHISRRR